MLKLILELLPEFESKDGDLIAIAKGKNKLPENFTELKQYLKTQLNGNN